MTDSSAKKEALLNTGATLQVDMLKIMAALSPMSMGARLTAIASMPVCSDSHCKFSTLRCNNTAQNAQIPKVHGADLALFEGSNHPQHIINIV